VKRDPPTIVIEHVSSGRRNRRRDYEAKREEYLAASIFPARLQVLVEPGHRLVLGPFARC
jgi:hypothetical protein